jgi:VWFA-related protein
VAVVSLAFVVTASLQAQNQALFRASTRLVQVGVVVEDRNGRPVTGLDAKDFRIFDGDREQRLELFLSRSTSPTIEARAATPADGATPLARNEFTNRLDAPGSVTVVLFDRLNTPAHDQLFARQQLVSFLSQIKSEDRVGLYVLESNAISVLHDFTNDARSLVREMSRYRAATSHEAVDVALPELAEIGDAAFDDRLAQFVEGTKREMEAHFSGLRGEVTVAAFQAIANHLSGIDGRKNLVWVTSGFPLTAFSDALKDPNAEIQRLIRPLNDSNVAVYPVDARGLVGGMTFDSKGKAAFVTLSSVASNQDILRSAAEETGGRAFVNTNDISRAVRRAVDEAQQTYTLGYYPDHARWDGTYRPIKVQVNRRGVRVRHRKGYVAAVQAGDRVSAKSAVGAALASPLQASGVEFRARLDRVADTPADVKVTIMLAPGTVVFERSGEQWDGAVGVAIGQKFDGGTLQMSVDRRVDFRLSPDRYETARQKGFALDVQVTLSPLVQNLHIVVHDLLSGATGSIVVPADRLRSIQSQ